MRARTLEQPNNAQTVDIAKYFVPASAIRAFIPTEYRFSRRGRRLVSIRLKIRRDNRRSPLLNKKPPLLTLVIGTRFR
jgi:hypothetical protein